MKTMYTKKAIFSQPKEIIRCFILNTLVALWVIYTNEKDKINYALPRKR